MSIPVLIVGAGPTGMTAALELSRLGIPVRLIERGPAPPPVRLRRPSGPGPSASRPGRWS
ncbi:FAD-dependent oxidoreductase [Sorangium sp. So ce296]|uniref:FAD-dependent oxidoreductase n=1 Tax=Sorangium sp. So ce296 TaxID=3133296 RepID=UPI003F64448D